MHCEFCRWFVWVCACCPHGLPPREWPCALCEVTKFALEKEPRSGRVLALLAHPVDYAGAPGPVQFQHQMLLREALCALSQEATPLDLIEQSSREYRNRAARIRAAAARRQSFTPKQHLADEREDTTHAVAVDGVRNYDDALALVQLVTRARNEPAYATGNTIAIRAAAPQALPGCGLEAGTAGYGGPGRRARVRPERDPDLVSLQRQSADPLARSTAYTRLLTQFKLRSDKSLTTTDVAKMFHVDRKTVSRWAKNEIIIAIRTPGGHYRFRESDVQAIIASGAIEQMKEKEEECETTSPTTSD